MKIIIYNDGNRYYTNNTEPATVNDMQCAIASLVSSLIHEGMAKMDIIKAVLKGFHVYSFKD